jgi:hypothetical protein
MKSQTNAILQTQETKTNAILEAIKTQSQPSLISGVDSTPILQGALSVAAQAFLFLNPRPWTVGHRSRAKVTNVASRKSRCKSNTCPISCSTIRKSSPW